MHTTLIESTEYQVIIPPLRFPRIVRITPWIILAGLMGLVALLVSLFFVKLFFSDVTSVTSSFRAATLDEKIGLGTEQFIQELTSLGLNPVPLQKITKAPFSVSGRIIALDGDNIQVFEYPRQDTALQEVSLLAEKYTTGTLSSRWKNTIHLYAKNTLAIFYMGNDKNILDALNKNAGLSLLEPRTIK